VQDTAIESISKIRIGDAQRKLEQTPSDMIPVPQASGYYTIDENVKKGKTSMILTACIQAYLGLMLAFPIPGTKVVHALSYGESLWGRTAKIVVLLPTEKTKNYFLKV